MASKRKTWTWTAGLVAAALVLGLVVTMTTTASVVANGCPGSQVYCAGVGCVSGMDKCVAGNKGGPSAVFSKEGFTSQCRAMTPCPGGTRTDGPCLMEFPEF